MSGQHCDLPGAVSDLPNNKHGALASRGPQWLLFPWLEFHMHTRWKTWSGILTVCLVGSYKTLDSFFDITPVRNVIGKFIRAKQLSWSFAESTIDIWANIVKSPFFIHPHGYRLENELHRFHAACLVVCALRTSLILECFPLFQPAFSKVLKINS